MLTNSSETKKPLRNELRRGLLFSLLFFTLFSAVAADGQTHREWRDTTLPEMLTPRRLGRPGQPVFPIGLFVYHYDYNRPFWELVPYLDRIGADHLIHAVQKSYDGYRAQDNWERYRELLDTLEGHGKRMVPLIAYGGQYDHPSYVVEAERGREIVFFPFDSSQMRYWGVYENVFTSYQYDSIAVNPEHFDPRDSSALREVIYNSGSLADQTVASGIAFDYRPGQTVRWDRLYQGGNWEPVSAASRINATALFEDVDYAWWNEEEERWEGDRYHTHRTPHYIVVTGHLFPDSLVDNNTPLLKINVWYEVDKGKVYRDSANIYRTADTNLRLLYKAIEVTKGELMPQPAIPVNWNAYREAAKKISFRKEGMGGPTDTGVTAKRFDLEVIYLGGEKLALRSVAVRDSIAHLLMDPGSAGNTYRANIERELDTLLRYGYSPDSAIRTGIYNLNIADEPPFTQFAGFRETKRLIERNFVADGADTLTTLNGWAIPFLQWLGEAGWHTKGNYLGNHFYDNGAIFKIDPNPGSPRYRDIPSVRQHNGGRWTIPELFDFDSLGSAPYAATLPGRIDTMELLFQHTRMGAALPEQTNLPWWITELWRVYQQHQAATQSTRMGVPFQNYIGPNSWFRLFYNDATLSYDTVADHRPERGELRAMLNLGLAYGARGITLYKFPTWPWMGRSRDSTVADPVGETEPGLGGFSVGDTAYNVIDWVLRDPNAGYQTVEGTTVIYDSLGLVPGIYFGFRNIYNELKESLPHIRELGEFMTRLRWRDAYSLHFQTDLPDNNYDSALVHRPLPPGEIITELTARHPVTGAVDPAWATYVELGLFETRIDTMGGVRNYLNDTNYVFVVNRRMFETGNYDTADIPYSAGVKALLDTLSETRTIRMKLNLHHPIEDSVQYEQYAFVRVREVLPDTSLPLPLLGKRAPLDTVLHADSAFFLTLGAGRGALLEITYRQPDTSIALAGDLLFPGQRKIVWDGNRYHMTYSRNDSIFYRRSMPVIGNDGGNTGSILWHEPVLVSDPLVPDNYTPSLTFRTAKGDTVVSIVWTRHRDDTTRQVVLRQLSWKGGGYVADNIEEVAWHYGYNAWEWGTPVVCRLHGADMFAWSDSVRGIHRVARVLDTAGTLWWKKPSPAVYTQGGPIFPTQGIWGVGRYPSLPPFAHAAGKDSNCALVWQQPMTVGGTVIYYARLRHWVNSLGTQATGAMNYGQLSPSVGNHFYPSICQTQDTFHRLQEGVAWSSTDTRFRMIGGPVKPYFVNAVNFRSVWTYLGESYTGGGDTIGPSQFWGYARYLLDSSSLLLPPGYPFANTTWVEQDYVSTPFKDSIVFSVAFGSWAGPVIMRQGPIRYGAETFAEGVYDYAFGGERPQGAAAPFRIPTRHAVLYRTGGGLSSRLQTTRQFFAKSRPAGYVAAGREVYYRTSSSVDSLQTGIMAVLHDAWVADEGEGKGLRLVERGPTGIGIDSLPQVNSLFRTEYFDASDSTMIGCRFSAWYVGDADSADDAKVDFVLELCDSATGLAVDVLDAVSIAAATADTHCVELMPEYDLLSGTYFLQLRMNVWNVAVDTLGYDSHFPVADIAEYIPVPVTPKYARRLDVRASSSIRLNAQPNPFGRETEIRFSVPRRDYVTVRLYDTMGRGLRTLVERELYDPGRYAVELERGNLTPGTYLVELRTGTERVTEKVLLK